MCVCSCGVFEVLFGTVNGTWEVEFTGINYLEGTVSVTLTKDEDDNLIGTANELTVDNDSISTQSFSETDIGNFYGNDGDEELYLNFSLDDYSGDYYSFILQGTVDGRSASGTCNFTTNNPMYTYGNGTGNFTMTKI